MAVVTRRRNYDTGSPVSTLIGKMTSRMITRVTKSVKGDREEVKKVEKGEREGEVEKVKKEENEDKREEVKEGVKEVVKEDKELKDKMEVEDKIEEEGEKEEEEKEEEEKEEEEDEEEDEEEEKEDEKEHKEKVRDVSNNEKSIDEITPTTTTLQPHTTHDSDSELSDVSELESEDEDISLEMEEDNTSAGTSKTIATAAITNTPTPSSKSITTTSSTQLSVSKVAVAIATATTAATPSLKVNSINSINSINNTTPTPSNKHRKLPLIKDQNDDKLMSMCIKVLKNSYPVGLTIRQINELIVKSMDDYEEICKSSTILSTKLNSFYRRCHSENGQLEISKLMTICPIIRYQAPELPRRLVYKWATEEDLIKERSKFEEESAKISEKHQQKQISKQQQQKESKKTSIPTLATTTSNSGSLTPPIDLQESSTSDLEDSDFESRRSKLVHRLPTPPPMSSTSPPPSPPYQLRKVIKRTPHAFTPPVKRTGGTGGLMSTHVKKFKKLDGTESSITSPTRTPIRTYTRIPLSPTVKGMNPYYDIEPHFTMKCTLEGDMYSKSWLYTNTSEDGSLIKNEIFEDIKSPEDLSVDDLDGMVV